jgi:hypothetical protein
VIEKMKEIPSRRQRKSMSITVAVDFVFICDLRVFGAESLYKGETSIQAPGR